MLFAFFSVDFVLLFFFSHLQLSLRLVYLCALDSLTLKLIDVVVVETLQYMRRTIQRITAIKPYFQVVLLIFLVAKDCFNS